METEQVGRLRDILEAARLIGSYVKDTSETDFHANKEKQDAVIRRIEIIFSGNAHEREKGIPACIGEGSSHALRRGDVRDLAYRPF